MLQAVVASGRGRAGFWSRWRVVALILGWCIVVAGTATGWREFPVVFHDSDDAMRLVEVRDYLAGQGWFDLHQYRLDPPSEVPMHWSRLVDWPIATLMRIAGTVAQGSTAEAWAMLVWPALLLIPCILLVWGLTARLVSGAAILAAAYFAFSNPQLVRQFTFGRIDHHNVQIVLTLAFLWLLSTVERRHHAIAAGVVMALMLAVGMETLPFMVIGVGYVAVGLIAGWLAPAAAAGFGLALASATLAAYAGLVPPSLWFAGACDALSANYLLLAVVGGLGLAAIARMAPRLGWQARLVSIVALAAVATAAFAVPEPACLRGPFAFVTPEARGLWLDHVGEVQPWWVIAADDSQLAWIAIYQPAIAVVAIAVLILMSASGRQPGFWLLAVSAMTALAIGVVQFRTLFYANVLAVPLVAAAVGALAARASARGHSAVLVAVFCAAVAGAPAVIVVEALAQRGRSPAPDTRSATVAQCLSAATYAPLANLPAGLVLAPNGYGPVILASTRHAVVQGPYHRQQRGIVLGTRMLREDPAVAVPAMRAHGIDYLVLCGRDGNVDANPDGLAARALDGGEIAGLTAIETGNGLRVYRVSRP